MVPTYYITDSDFDPFGFQNLKGFTPGRIPKVTQALWVTYQLPKGFLIMVGDHYASRRATDAYNLFWMPRYATLEAGLTYRRPRMEYSLNVMNLTNSRYWVSSIDDTQIYPGQPINAVATIRYRLGKL